MRGLYSDTSYRVVLAGDPRVLADDAGSRAVVKDMVDPAQP